MKAQQPAQSGAKPQVLFFAEKGADGALVDTVEKRTHLRGVCQPLPLAKDCLLLWATAEGLVLTKGGCDFRLDFSAMPPRTLPNNLNHELLIKAAKFKNPSAPLTAIDATAGLGQDAFLLAAAGFSIELYERNPVIAVLLYDAICRGKKDEKIAPILARMTLHMEDSIDALPRLSCSPDVVVLDPMFPQRQKSGLIKKKFQLLHLLEQPCQDECDLLKAATSCHPRRIVIKKPSNGPFLADRKPPYTLKGGTTRYDCIVCR